MSEAQSLDSQAAKKPIPIGDNGLIFSDQLLPVELIQRILCHVDGKTLLNCRLVCKCWNDITTDYVWRKKAEIETGCKIPADTILGVKDFFLICTKNLFGRNLVKNHSGEGNLIHWDIVHNGGDRWAVERPPIGAPLLPQEPEFESKQHCFVTSYGECCKKFTIDLIAEGFSANILDNLQPPIEVRRIHLNKLHLVNNISF